MSWIKRTAKSIVRKYIYGKNLEDNGMRVDIKFNGAIEFDKLDVYEKSHYRRYEFAEKQIPANIVCADMACGTGYGSAMIASKGRKVVGVDIDKVVVEKISKRYQDQPNLKFVNSDLLDITYNNEFDAIVSFETIEHLEKDDIPTVISKFGKTLKPGGKLIMSTPYMQEASEIAIKMGCHKTFYINEDTISKWLDDAGFNLLTYKYQDYNSHEIRDDRLAADFVICVAEKQ